MISQDGQSGVVAIPTNDNSWPSYHRKKAEELMRQQFPSGYIIDREEEFVTATIQNVQTYTNRMGDPILAALRIAPIKEEKTESTTLQNHTEWRIYFHRADAPSSLIPSSKQ